MTNKPDNDKKILFIRVTGGVECVNLPDIIYCKGAGSQSELHLINKPVPLISSFCLTQLETMLPRSVFLRIHKSYIINMHHIVSCKICKDPEIKMSNHKIVTASRTYKNALLKIFNKGVLAIAALLHFADYMPDDFFDWGQWMDVANNFM